MNGSSREREVLERCQRALPAWRGLDVDDFDFAPPKGFSSFTMGVRCKHAVQPPAVLYRHLEGKKNAILDYEGERVVYLALAAAGVAAECLAYDRIHRIEAFYEGRTLTRHDLGDHDILAKIGEQLAKLHSLEPALPPEPFFDLLHARWRELARAVLVDARDSFPAHEREMCDELLEIVEPSTLDKVRRCLPTGPLGFCHNDTYHGNIMLLETGEIRLLDFEFSCLNHRAFDFANLFAETVMRHGEAEPPHFSIAAPEYGRDDIGALIDGYLEHSPLERSARERLIDETESSILVSDFMYAMAALPLAVEPIQKIRFIPYAHRRFGRFLDGWRARFGA